ncbi:MAG: hypothetical protein ACI9BD_001538, partial [Candidatus Marinamargulisbacteria bacterium]
MGKGNLAFAVTGKMDNPLIKGTLFGQTARIYALPTKKLEIGFRFQKNILNATLLSGKLYEGDLSGAGQFNFRHHPPTLAFDLDAHSLKIEKAFPTMKNRIHGDFDLTTTGTGKTDDFAVEMTITSNELSFYEQKLKKGAITFDVLNNKDILDIEAALIFNQGQNPVAVSGNIVDLLHTTLQYEGTHIPVADFDPSPNHQLTGTANLKGTFHTQLSPRFWVKPLDEVSVTFSASLRDFYFYNQPFERGAVDIAFSKQYLDIYEILAENKDEKALIRGSFLRKKPTSLFLSLNNLNLTQSKFVQKHVPPDIKPFGGIASIDLSMTKKSQEQASPIKKIKWLSQYDLSASLSVIDGLFQNQPLDQTHLSLLWQGPEFNIRQASIFHEDSKIFFKGAIQPNQKLDIEIQKGTVINFSDFSIFTAPLGSLEGSLQVRGLISGTSEHPKLNLNIIGKKVKSNFVAIELAQGGLTYEKQKIGFENFELRHNANQYVLDGYLDYTGLNPAEPIKLTNLGYEISLSVKDTNMAEFIDFVETLYAEAQFRSKLNSIINNEQIVNANMKIGKQKKKANPFRVKSPYRYTVFTLGSNRSLLGHFDKIETAHTQDKKPEKSGLGKVLSGKLNGVFKAVSRKGKNPLITAGMTIQQGQIYFAKAKKFSLDITPNKKKEEMEYSLSLEKGTIGNKYFDRLHTYGQVDKSGTLQISDTTLDIGDLHQNSILQGNIPLASIWDSNSKEESMSVHILLEKNTIGLLAFLNPVISDITNNGYIAASVSGPLSAPRINSQKISLSDAKLTFTDESIFKSPFSITHHEISIVDNEIRLPTVDLKWAGADTKEQHTSTKRENHFITAGTIHLNDLNFRSLKQVNLFFDLDIQDTNLVINLPKVYQGNINIANTHIFGNYHVPLGRLEKEKHTAALQTDSETGPLISATATLSNSTIQLPKPGTKTLKPSFLLDVKVPMKSNVFISGSLLGEGILAGISADLEVSDQTEVYVSGSLNAPKIHNRVLFTKGSINILNREFELLELAQQKFYYKEKQYQTKQNTISFVTEKNAETEKNQLIPILDISALSIIEEAGTTTTSDI